MLYLTMGGGIGGVERGDGGKLKLEGIGST
mgnify:CR=1 FL=1